MGWGEATAPPTPASREWWICTQPLTRGGKKVLGPFGTEELALEVRVYLEKIPVLRRPPGPSRLVDTFAIDSTPTPGGPK